MPLLNEAQQGDPLEIAGEETAFSLWPVRRTTRRYGIQHRVFAADPWPLIHNAINQRCPKTLQGPARAFCAQAEDFYETSFHGRSIHAKPLLIYYSMLNLAKAFILTTNNAAHDYKPHHGLRESASPRQIPGAEVLAFLQKNRPSAFNDFLYALSGWRLSANRAYRLREILPQILTGHRVWCDAANAKERFVGVHEVRFLINPTDRLVWAQIVLKKNDVARLKVSNVQLLKGTLRSNWKVARLPSDPSAICIEKIIKDKYSHRPSDVLMNVIEGLRHSLWTSVLSVPPYSKYYLYVTPTAQRAKLLPQLSSMYMTLFFLGSITRYRPHHFDRLIESRYGAQIEGMLHDVPSQFLYLIASEFLKRDVSRAAIA